MSVRAVVRKPVAPNPKTVQGHKNGVEVDQIPIDTKVKNLVVVRVPEDTSAAAMEHCQKKLAKALGRENLVIVMPKGAEIEVISLQGLPAEDVEERKKKADWAF